MTTTPPAPATPMPSTAPGRPLERVGRLLDALDLDTIAGNGSTAVLVTYVDALHAVATAARKVLDTPLPDGLGYAQRTAVVEAHRPLRDAVGLFDRLIAS